MIDFSSCIIENAAVHQVGNKTNGGELYFSKRNLDLSDQMLSTLLLKFFITPFADPEYYSFTFSNDDFTLNPVFQYASQIFAEPADLHRISIDIAKHLFELSVHPNIKSGDLFIVFFSGIQIDNDVTDAVGIFKSENRQSFLTLQNEKGEFNIKYDDGISIDKLDKGCLILNHDVDKGFKVCIVDKSSKSIEAQFWKDSFLQIKACSDDYHYTTDYMQITKEFVIKHLPKEVEIEKVDQIEYLNRSADYFKTREKFDKRDFEESVFQDDNIIDSFRTFDNQHRKYREAEAFDISPNAVKKQLRVYKSILKLDNNFHIYIHGNSEMIERGTERDGRKYYKIYFENEG